MKKRISLFAESHIPFLGIAYAIFRPLPPRTGHWIFPRVSAIPPFRHSATIYMFIDAQTLKLDRYE
ncbi:MAG: hypothetical protein IKY84_07235 [Bacteroidaceae bacterium]|nr:hypothetical protein [Bacteroidaceae bacterium]